MREDKITIFQAAAIYILVSIVPVVRYFPIIMTNSAGKSAWVAALLSIIPSIFLVFTLNILMNRVKTRNGIRVNNLTEVFNVVYGKVLGTILSIIYLLWIVIFASTELRLFAERLISTTFVYAPVLFFILTMLILVFFIVRGRVSNFGRFAEIFLELFIIIFVFILLTSSSNISLKNFWPVTVGDAKGIGLGIIKGTNVFNMFTFAMFLGDKIIDKENIKKVGIMASVITGCIGMIGIIVTLGTYGSDLLPTLSQPFFMALKVISLFGVLERIEALFITFWAVADFVLIAYSLLVASNICKQKFKLTKRRIAVTPIVFITFILSLIIANNYFSLQMLFINYMSEFNLIIALGLPILTYIIAKFRGLVENK